MSRKRRHFQTKYSLPAQIRGTTTSSLDDYDEEEREDTESQASNETSSPTRYEPPAEDKFSDSIQGTLRDLMRGRIIIKYEPMSLVISVAWLLFISWIYLRDNELGRLETFAGLLWLAAKTVTYTVLYGLGSWIILGSIRRRQNKA